MNYKRKDFIKISGQVAAAIALTPLACKLMPKKKDSTENGKPLESFGLQLYSVRDDMEKDPEGILKQLASFGYKQLESYEGPKGMFWGMSHTDFKKYMDELGMSIIASHCDINKDFEKKADEAAAIGMKYLICPSIDAQKTIEEYKRITNQFNQCGELCKKSGLKFAYHNHDHDLQVLDGQVVQEVYMQNTDPALVDFEMDIYWVITAGHDPKTWLNKYPGRFSLCHIKDRIKGASERDASCELGTGSIDFPPILKIAKANGMQYYFAEQERYDNSTPMKSVQADAEYMKKLRI